MAHRIPLSRVRNMAPGSGQVYENVIYRKAGEGKVGVLHRRPSSFCVFFDSETSLDEFRTQGDEGFEIDTNETKVTNELNAPPAPVAFYDIVSYDKK